MPPTTHAGTDMPGLPVIRPSTNKNTPTPTMIIGQVNGPNPPEHAREKLPCQEQ